MTGRAPGRRADVAPVLAAVAAAFVPYRDLFTSAVPVARDLPFYFYPVKAHLAEALRSGQVPWVDPYRWGGVPLLGAPGAAAFYPGNVLFVLLPLGIAMKAWVFVHLAPAVSGFAAFARRLGLAPAWAAASGLAFALGGVSVSLAPFPSSFSAMAILPWFAASVLDLSGAPAPRNAVKTAFLAALLLLTGVPEFVVFAAVVAAALLVVKGPSPARAFGLAAAAALLAGALGAPQLLPSTVTATRSVRGPGGGMDEVAAREKSLAPVRLVEIVGDGLVADWTQVAGTSGVPDYPYLPSITPGRVTLLLALVGLFAGGKGRLPALCLVLLGIGLALGPAGPVWQGASRAAPFLLSLRFPEKFLVLAGFGLAWLGALGAGALSARLRTREALLAGLLGLAILVDRERTARLLLETDEAACLTKAPDLLRSLVAGRPGEAPPPRIFHLDNSAPVPRFDMADLPAAGRTARASLDPAYGSLFGAAYLFEPDYDLGLPREAVEWNRMIGMSAPTSSPMTLRIARAAGVRAVVRSVESKDGRFVPGLRPLPDPLPPYRFARRVARDSDPRRLFRRFLDEEAEPDTAWVVRPGEPALLEPAPGRVEAVRDRYDGLSLDVAVDGPRDAYLVLWRLLASVEEATMDGGSVTVEENAFGFSGLPVPPGRHRLRFRPSEAPVRWGLGIAATGLVAAMVALRRRPPHGETRRDGAER